MGDLSSRRGKIHGMDMEGTFQLIKAHVPAKELYRYSSTLPLAHPAAAVCIPKNSITTRKCRAIRSKKLSRPASKLNNTRCRNERAKDRVVRTTVLQDLRTLRKFF